jgi:hypothetical protein
MHARRLITIVITSGGLGLSCLFIAGCGDDSKTTGTQLQLTAEDKAFIKGMRGTMKGQRAAQKQEQAEKRNRKK